MKTPLTILFRRYLDGQSTSRERQQLYDYFGTIDDNHLRQLIGQELITHDNLTNPDPVLFHAILENINKEIDEKQAAKFATVKYLRVASAIAAALILFTGIYLFTNRAVEMKTVYAPPGRRIFIRLPDSSTAWLNGGSTIQYPSRFVDGKRVINLQEGEAFFNIKHDPDKMFIVHNMNADIEVLGTSFEIHSFSKERTASIAVSSGKVGVIVPGIGQPNYLLPGRRAIINKTLRVITTSAIDTADIAAWRSGRLVFEDQPLGEVINDLERTYNVHIEVRNKKLLSDKITMRLNNQPLKDVLAAFGFANHFNYEIINDQLVVIK